LYREITTTPLALKIKDSSALWIIAVGFLFIAFLMLYRLPQYPAPWIDEGAVLRVAKNFAQNGIYAEPNLTGNNYSGAIVGVGPTVILPVALVVKLFGPNIGIARLVIVLYSLICVIFFYKLASSLSNWRLAVIATAIMTVSPAVDFQRYGRSVIGEVPAVTFLVIALWLWLRKGKRTKKELLVVGLLFGLSCITKSQYATIILPTLLVSWLVNMIWHKQPGRFWFFVIPGIVSGIIFFAWTYYVLFRIGVDTRNVVNDLAVLRSTNGTAFFVWNSDIIIQTIHYLTDREMYGVLLFSGLLYGIIVSVKRDEDGLNWSILTLLVSIGLFLFISSIGWPRYAFIPAVFAAILVARLLNDLSDSFRFRFTNLQNIGQGYNTSVMVIMAGFIIVLIGLASYGRVQNVLKLGNDDSYHVADYLNTNVPQDQVIETWEYELGFLTNHRYHFPEQIYMSKMNEHIYFAGVEVSELYDFRSVVNPNYVIIGPYSLISDIYPSNRLTNYSLIYSVGDYRVYKKN
jgi:4-amino-4-deoxy-L-arabinose transferase-like glycosyltransferase